MRTADDAAGVRLTVGVTMCSADFDIVLVERNPKVPCTSTTRHASLVENPAVLTVFGFGVFAFLFFGMLWRTAVRWRYLAGSYAGEHGRAIETRRMQNGVLLGLSGYNVVKGILNIGVHANGISFRILPPFSLFHRPLFIPYDDIRGWRTTWYLDSPSVALEFRNAPDVKMVVPADQAEWMRKFAGQKMVLHDTTPPNGKAGRGWYAFALASAGISLLMLVTLAVILLMR